MVVENRQTYETRAAALQVVVEGVQFFMEGEVAAIYDASENPKRRPVT